MLLVGLGVDTLSRVMIVARMPVERPIEADTCPMIALDNERVAVKSDRSASIRSALGQCGDRQISYVHILTGR